MTEADSSPKRAPTKQDWFPSVWELARYPRSWDQRVGLGALATLVAFGVYRSVWFGWFPALRQAWTPTVIVLALAAALGALAGFRKSAQWSYVLLAVWCCVLAVGYLQPQRVASDGAFYYAPLRSLVVDLDLDFQNEYRTLGARREAFVPTATGRLPNPFSVGPALAWSPFFIVTHCIGKLGAFRPTGFGYPYFTTVTTVGSLLGFIGVLAMFDVLRRLDYEESIAAVAAGITWLGSFHVWYMTFEASMSHAPAMAMVALYLLFCLSMPTGWRAWIWAGVLAGAVVLMRWQNIVFLPVILAIVDHKQTEPSNGFRSHITSRYLPYVAACLFTVLPQIVYWYILYGRPALIPQGNNFMNWSSPEMEAVLFSSRHGLFAWTPLLYVCLAGIPLAFRRRPWLIAGLGLAFAVTAYVNAAAADWWAGASFSLRRFDGSLILAAIGLAASLAWGRRLVVTRPLAVCVVALVPFLVWNGILMDAYFRGRIPPDGPASFQRVASEAVERAYRLVGYPFSWPGAIAETWTRKTPLASYDLLGSHVLYNNIDIKIGLSDELFLGEGWSPLDRLRGGRAIHTNGATVLMPLRESVDYRVQIEGSFRPGELEVSFNARVINGEFSEDHWVARIPAAIVAPGPNQLRMRPVSPRELLVSRVYLSRQGESGR